MSPAQMQPFSVSVSPGQLSESLPSSQVTVLQIKLFMYRRDSVAIQQFVQFPEHTNQTLDTVEHMKVFTPALDLTHNLKS